MIDRFMVTLSKWTEVGLMVLGIALWLLRNMDVFYGSLFLLASHKFISFITNRFRAISFPVQMKIRKDIKWWLKMEMVKNPYRNLRNLHKKNRQLRTKERLKKVVLIKISNKIPFMNLNWIWILIEDFTLGKKLQKLSEFIK